MELLETCLNCGNEFKFEIDEDENGMPGKSNRVIQCGKCKKCFRVNIDGIDVKLEPVDETELTIIAMREIAEELSNGKFKLMQSKHEMIVKDGVGKKQPVLTNVRKLTVIYEDTTITMN